MMRLSATILLTFLISSCFSQPALLSPEAFARIYLDSLGKRYPDIAFTLNKDLTIHSKTQGKTLQLFTDNAYIAYKAMPDSVSGIISGHMAVAGTLLYPRSIAITPSFIIPVIKPADYPEMIQHLDTENKPARLVTAPYNDGLIIVYAHDNDSSIQYLTEKDAAALAISADSLKKLALANLGSMMQQVKPLGMGGLYMVDAGGVYEASLLLLPGIWTKEYFSVDGDFIVSVPNRDMLIVTGSHDKANLEKLRQMTANSYQTGSYPVSEHLYRRKGGKFELFE